MDAVENAGAPKGERREVKGLGGVTIGGAPVAYVAILAAIVTVFAFIPASVVVGAGGGGWPLHDAIHPLVGLILGPIAGPIASVIGILLGQALAPYTSLGPYTFTMGLMSAFAAGMVMSHNRNAWIVPWVLILILHIIYFILPISRGVEPIVWFPKTFTITLSLILIAIPPVRHWVVNTIREGGVTWQTFLATYILFLFASTGGQQALWVPAYATNPWPNTAWALNVPLILAERTLFPLIGTFIAMGVMAGLRRSTFVKPAMAGY
jgi:hypothetical protein